MKYASGGALRQALDRRLVQEANETGVDVARLRRRIVFERLLARLARDGRWVLKGGVAVEVRLVDRARATKDLDLALLGVESEGSYIRELLVDALLTDPQRDYFEFRIDRFRATSPDGAPGLVWRASPDGRLDGRTFDRIAADIVLAGHDVARVEYLRLPSALSFAGLEPVEILAVDLNQHFAEKLHAMTRQYGDGPSTRVKDLADLMLFIETGLQPTADLVRAVSEVFAARESASLTDIPDPPATWALRYEEYASELRLPWSTLPDAMSALREFWSLARALVPST